MGGAGGREVAVFNGVWDRVTSQGTEPSRLGGQPWLLIWERARGQLSPAEAGKSPGMAGAICEWGSQRRGQQSHAGEQESQARSGRVEAA